MTTGENKLFHNIRALMPQIRNWVNGASNDLYVYGTDKLIRNLELELKVENLKIVKEQRTEKPLSITTPYEIGLGRATSEIQTFFMKKRFDPNHHLNSGEVRLTIGDEEELTENILALKDKRL